MKVFIALIVILLGLAILLTGLIMVNKLIPRKAITDKALMSVTKVIFVSTQISALIWVFTSYGIAIYSTVKLGQVYTMAELSEPAIHTILGVGFLKVLENIFEHNDGGIFGRSKNKEKEA